MYLSFCNLPLQSLQRNRRHLPAGTFTSSMRTLRSARLYTSAAVTINNAGRLPLTSSLLTRISFRHSTCSVSSRGLHEIVIPCRISYYSFGQLSCLINYPYRLGGPAMRVHGIVWSLVPATADRIWTRLLIGVYSYREIAEGQLSVYSYR